LTDRRLGIREPNRSGNDGHDAGRQQRHSTDRGRQWNPDSPQCGCRLDPHILEIVLEDLENLAALLREHLEAALSGRQPGYDVIDLEA